MLSPTRGSGLPAAHSAACWTGVSTRILRALCRAEETAHSGKQESWGLLVSATQGSSEDLEPCSFYMTQNRKFRSLGVRP